MLLFIFIQHDFEFLLCSRAGAVITMTKPYLLKLGIMIIKEEIHYVKLMKKMKKVSLRWGWKQMGFYSFTYL